MVAVQQVVVPGGGGVELHVEVRGEPQDPVLLLIGGASWSMDWWDAEFCDRLVLGGRRVVRYDQRDTGRSTHWPVGAPGYTAVDLVADAAAVLDGVGAVRAHVVGLSMGGGLAQRLALAHRGRVATLTLIATSPVDPSVTGLPGPSDEIAASFSTAPQVDWCDRDAVVEHLVETERPYAGPDAFDEEAVRATAQRVVERSLDVEASLTNHGLVQDGKAWDDRLDALAGTPTLVLHGTADPLFPLAHGRALADAVPGARFVALEGVGHQLPPRRSWDLVLTHLLQHTRER